MLTELVLLPLWASVAVAEDTPCTYDLAQLDADLDESERKTSAWDAPGAVAPLQKARDQLPCLTVPIPPEALGRFARQSALLAFLDQDDDQATIWAALAVSTGPLLWPSELDLPPGFPPFVDRVPVPVKKTLANKGLVVPEQGAILMDGAFLAKPEALVETPHLVQVADRHGVVVRAFWQDGVAFPPDLLGPPVKVTHPKWWGADLISRAKPDREPRSGGSGMKRTRIALATSAATMAVVAGASYGTSFGTRAAFDNAEEVDLGLYRANQATWWTGVVAGGVAVGLGAGFGVTFAF